MNLIECLLRIADTGLYPIVLEIFKHGIQRSGELIFLGLLQLHVRFTSLFRTEPPLQFFGLGTKITEMPSRSMFLITRYKSV